MTWRPLDRLPSALELALRDAVRSAVLDVDVGANVVRDHDGLLALTLPDGRTLRVDLRPTTRTPARFGPRLAIRHDFQGRAVLGRTSYGLAAHATLDTKTEAFVDVHCDVLWRDEA